MALKIESGFIVVILTAIVTALSPAIKKLLREMIQKLYDAAKASKNPVDDVFVKLLADILDVEIT